MRTVRLGRTGLEVSRVGLGGIPLTRPGFSEAVDLVRRALDLGVTIIDTAYGYKDSENRIGEGIRGRRGDVVLATKGGHQDRATVLGSIETSLGRLGTDYIDIWQFHGVTRAEDYDRLIAQDGPYEAALEARQAGKIRFVGLSSHSIDTAIRAVESGLFDVIHYQLNLISQEATGRLIDLARERGVGYLAMKPFAGGMIRDAGLAIRYLLQYDNVVPVPGVEKVSEIEEIVSIAESVEAEETGQAVLTGAEAEAIEKIRSETNSRFCRQCEYCLPCPENVFIPGILYLSKLWALWPRDHMLSWGFPKSAVESAAGCTKCGECETKCPYSLPIREMIDESLEFHRKMVEEVPAGGA